MSTGSCHSDLPCDLILLLAIILWKSLKKLIFLPMRIVLLYDDCRLLRTFENSLELDQVCVCVCVRACVRVCVCLSA